MTAVLGLPPAARSEQPKEPVAAAAREAPGIPDDLIDDPHVREETAVNEFTAPSISKIFETLEKLTPLPVNEVERKLPARGPSNRADLAVELGFLIADGFLVVQTGEMAKIPPLAKELSQSIKSLGPREERVTAHSAAILEAADKSDLPRLKKELTATQKDVETELVRLQDADLAHLISLGGWIRAFEIATVAVEKNFSVDRAKIIMREDIADYYEYSVGSLEPSISERPNYIQIRDLLAGLRTEMTLKPGQDPTKEDVADVRKVSAELVKLALQRHP